jgi:hypothetical protein
VSVFAFNDMLLIFYFLLFCASIHKLLCALLELLDALHLGFAFFFFFLILSLSSNNNVNFILTCEYLEEFWELSSSLVLNIEPNRF